MEAQRTSLNPKSRLSAKSFLVKSKPHLAACMLFRFASQNFAINFRCLPTLWFRIHSFQISFTLILKIGIKMGLNCSGII